MENAEVERKKGFPRSFQIYIYIYVGEKCPVGCWDIVTRRKAVPENDIVLCAVIDWLPPYSARCSAFIDNFARPLPVLLENISAAQTCTITTTTITRIVTTVLFGSF